MNDIVRKISNLPFGGTDCSLPMFEARRRGEKFDAFVVFTDNETWVTNGNYGYSSSRRTAASGNPMKELREYRSQSGIRDAKLAVVATASTGFTIADPDDFNTMDFVGMDASAPKVLSEFIAR